MGRPIHIGTDLGTDLAGADATGLEGLFADQYDALVRLAYLIVGSTEAAEDVAQEAFVKVGLRWRTIDDPPRYIKAAVVNGARSVLRRRHREHRRPLEREIATTDTAAVDDALGLRDVLPRTGAGEQPTTYADGSLTSGILAHVVIDVTDTLPRSGVRPTWIR